MVNVVKPKVMKKSAMVKESGGKTIPFNAATSAVRNVASGVSNVSLKTSSKLPYPGATRMSYPNVKTSVK